MKWQQKSKMPSYQKRDGRLLRQQSSGRNNSFVQREIRASAHLKDWEDVLFWDTMRESNLRQFSLKFEVENMVSCANLAKASAASTKS